METAVIALLSALAAAAVTWALMRAAVVRAQAEARAKAESADAREASFRELLAAQKDASERSVETLRAEFSSLAAATLEGRAKALAADNAAQVKPLFDALREQFEAFGRAAREAQAGNERLGVALEAKLAEVGEKAAGLGRRAEEFVAALKGGGKVQGNWGEGILRTTLESAGLVEGENFVEQSGTREAGLPDVTVFDGRHRKILIDAKVNIDSFTAAANASGQEADRLMAEHARRVRSQVDALAAKRYPVQMKASDPDPDAVYSPVVIMFMPSEATFLGAVKADPTLVSYANSRSVMLATPQMLLGYLVVFKMAIDRVQVARSQEEIARRAKQVIDRVDAAFACLEKVGRSLDDAQSKYHSALAKLGLEPGAQNVLTPARELMRLVGHSPASPSAALAAAPDDPPQGRER